MRRCLAVLAVLSCLAIQPALAERRGMTGRLDGRKVGTLQIDRDVSDGTVTTTQTRASRLTRIQTPLVKHAMGKAVELQTENGRAGGRERV